MIQAQDICFHYKGGGEILHQISFGLETGRFLAILGNNGAGKSTLLKCFANIHKADRGTFLLDGEDLFSMSGREAAKRTAFVSQTIPDPQMTVRDVILLGRRPYMRWSFTKQDHAVVQKAMERLDLLSMQDRFFHQLSGGERQKVMLARALAQQPRLLLLDEPTSSLDIRNQYQVLESVRSLCREDGLTAIVVIHDLSLALRFCDRFLMLRDGTVYRYGGREILDPLSLRETYGVDAKVVEVEGKPLVMVS